jgi:hypothetical protein
MRQSTEVNGYVEAEEDLVYQWSQALNYAFIRDIKTPE